MQSNVEPIPGDLLFVRGRDWVSHEIEEVTHSTYSHVAGYVKDNELIEAQGFRRVGYQALDTYDGCADIYRCDMTETQHRMIMNYVSQHIGERYDYLLIAWEFIRYVFNLTLPYHKSHRVVCSTLWSDAYRYAGIDLCPGIKYPSPADLAESKLLTKVGSY